MIIEKLNGERIDLTDYNVERLFHYIPSAPLLYPTTTIEGRHGLISQVPTYENREITVELLYKVKNIYEYYTLRDILNDIFTPFEPFYIIFKRDSGRRWKVRLSGSVSIPPSRHMAKFEAIFTTIEPFAESIEEKTHNFTTANFNLYNHGNVKIDPRQSDLRITLKGTFASLVTIKNNTTNEEFRYTGALASANTLIIDNTRYTRNGTSITNATNKKLITLAPGENSFSVTGGTVSSVQFVFRELFK